MRIHEQYDIPLTEAELAAAEDALVEEYVLTEWARHMPQPEQPKPKRKLDTRQFSVDEQIATAIEANNAFWHDVITGVIGTVQHRFNDKFKLLEQRIKDLETAFEIERQVNVRISQIEQRYQQQQLKAHHANSNGHA